MTNIQYDFSPFGKILLAADELGLSGLWFGGAKCCAAQLPAQHSEREMPVLSEAMRWLDVYFSGKDPVFTPPLHISGSPFQETVWNILLRIPYGQTTTYGAIARQLAAQNHAAQVAARLDTIKFLLSFPATAWWTQTEA